MKQKMVRGFSRMTEEEKRAFISRQTRDADLTNTELESYLFSDAEKRKHFLELSENTVSSFHTPYGITPNVVVDGKVFHVPMAIEESSVVAAASHAARFWADQGGFHVKEISTVKLGHVYFRWFGDPDILQERWNMLKSFLIERLHKVTASMVRRGGGILDMKLISFSGTIGNLYKIELAVETVNSMGANFINNCLEETADGLIQFFTCGRETENGLCQVAMSILTNHTPECTVTVEASCQIAALESIAEKMPVEPLAEKIVLAYEIARQDPFRAATHNKGIMNGVDAVLMATGNDYRAAEAAAHTYASKEGQYRALSYARREEDQLLIGITLPLAIGTVGGITNLHPLARLSIEILGNPTARELMGIVASVGLCSNFVAVRSLVTTGIQKGHMRLHLSNILNMLNASAVQRKEAEEFFFGQKVSFTAVKHFLDGKHH